MKPIYIVLLACALSACASKENSAFLSSGSDQLPPSACQACEKEPFYKDGKWLAR